MLKFRVKIIERILSVSSPTLVEKAIHDAINDISANDEKRQDFHQYLQYLKADIVFQMKLKQNQREFSNLNQALTVIQNSIKFEENT